MTNVSNLSREIAQEIMELTGCQLSVDDYLKIREKAEIEVSKGLFKVESTPVFIQTQSQIQPVAQQVVVQQAPVTASVPVSAPIQESTPAPIVEKSKPVQNVRPIQKKQVNHASEEEEDPFFAMCDKL